MGKVILLVIVLIFFTIIWSAFKYVNNIDKKYTYVHIKTGNKYRIFEKCLLKYNGNWINAVIYISIDTNEVYVVEYSDFILNFKTLLEWEKKTE